MTRSGRSKRRLAFKRILDKKRAYQNEHTVLKMENARLKAKLEVGMRESAKQERAFEQSKQELDKCQRLTKQFEDYYEFWMDSSNYWSRNYHERTSSTDGGATHCMLSLASCFSYLSR